MAPNSFAVTFFRAKSLRKARPSFGYERMTASIANNRFSFCGFKHRLAYYGTMLGDVFGATHYFQIFYSIVNSVPVFMVNYFARFKRPSAMSLHNDTMLCAPRFRGHPYINISIWSYVPPARPSLGECPDFVAQMQSGFTAFSCVHGFKYTTKTCHAT